MAQSELALASTPRPTPIPHPPQRVGQAQAAEDALARRTLPTLDQSQLADAAIADDGGAGGPGAGGTAGDCDMAGRLQEVLRRDQRVHAEIGRYAGKAILVWNGEWAWMPGDLGQGLTAVRQALIWEIAYAPEACRGLPMKGLVVFSLDEAKGRVRLAVGRPDWRWTELLAPHGGLAAR